MKKNIILKIFCVLFLLLIIAGCDNKNEIQIEKQVSNKPKHSFSINENDSIYFAESNIQYNPVKKIWRFAENAYDTIGMDNELVDENYDGWIDLFAWGANGISGIEPYSTIYDNLLYGNGHNNIEGTKWDFGSAINEQLNGKWRMFTHEEIHYILMFRENAEKLFGYGTIDGIRGLFLLPDDWISPNEITFTPSVDIGFENQYDWYYTIGDNDINYTYNIFNKEEWKLIKDAGGVFLPATGMRNEKTCNHIGISGHYWTSSYYGEEFANCICFFEKDLFTEGNFDRSTGLGVRLVKDAK